jgi:hypothetical protein
MVDVDGNGLELLTDGANWISKRASVCPSSDGPTRNWGTDKSDSR